MAGCVHEAVVAWGMARVSGAGRVPAVGAVSVLMVLMLAACDQDDVSRGEPVGSRSQAASEPVAGPERAVVELDLAAGASTVEQQFEALDPRSHTQTIEVSLEPVGSGVTVEFVTADGATLHVLDTGMGLPPDHCVVDADAARCTVRFPVLEGRLPGEWTVVAAKSAGAATRVEVEILWEAVEAS